MTSELVFRRSELEAVSQGCLFRVKALWIDGTDDSSDMSLVGIGFHAIQHRYTLALVEAGMMADSELATRAFVEGVAAVQTPSRLLPELRRVWMWHAEKWELNLEQYVTAEEKGQGDGKGFTPDLVTADASTNTLEIHDFKSGWSPIVTEEELRDLYQARFYIRYGQNRWPGFAHYKFTLHAIRFNKSVSVVFTKEELDHIALEVEANIATLKDAMETNRWPAVAGPGCKWCSLRCPLMDQPMAMPKRILEQSEAQKIAAFVMGGEAMLKAAKKVLKAWVSAHGPLDVQGVVWDNRESQSTLYPIDVLLDVLQQRSILGAFQDAKQQGLTISKSALAKLMKQYPELVSDLAQFAISKFTFRFSGKKAGEDEEAE